MIPASNTVWDYSSKDDVDYCTHANLGSVCCVSAGVFEFSILILSLSLFCFTFICDPKSSDGLNSCTRAYGVASNRCFSDVCPTSAGDIGEFKLLDESPVFSRLLSFDSDLMLLVLEAYLDVHPLICGSFFCFLDGLLLLRTFEDESR